MQRQRKSRAAAGLPTDTRLHGRSHMERAGNLFEVSTGTILFAERGHASFRCLSCCAEILVPELRSNWPPACARLAICSLDYTCP